MAVSRIADRVLTDERTTDPSASGPPIAVILTLVLSLAGAVIMLIASPYGIHATPDSFTYLGAADRLADGRGWTYPFGEIGTPVTLFPPLYPLLLALPAWLGVDAFDWVLWQNALLLAAFGVVVGATVAAATRGNAIASATAAVLTLLGLPTLAAYSRIWSESVFFPLVVGVIAVLDRFLAKGRWPWLATAGILSGLAMLTRYAGLSLFVTVCVVLALWPGRRLIERFRAVALYSAFALPLTAAWLIRNQIRSRTLTGNNELIHSLELSDVLDGFRTIGSWLLHDPIDGPTPWPIVLAIASAALLVIVGSLMLIRRHELEMLRPPSIALICLGYVVVHFSFIAVANAFSTRAPPFNTRILGPAFAPLVIALIATGHRYWSASGARAIFRTGIALATLALLASSFTAAIETVPGSYGAMPASRDRYRFLSNHVAPVADDRAMPLSNRSSKAWYILGKPVTALPKSCRGGWTFPSPTYQRELETLSRRLGDRPREVYLFGDVKTCEPYSLQGLRTTLRLERRAHITQILVLAGPATA